MIHRINSIVGGIDFVAIIEFKFEKDDNPGQYGAATIAVALCGQQ